MSAFDESAKELEAIARAMHQRNINAAAIASAEAEAEQDFPSINRNSLVFIKLHPQQYDVSMRDSVKYS